MTHWKGTQLAACDKNVSRLTDKGCLGATKALWRRQRLTPCPLRRQTEQQTDRQKRTEEDNKRIRQLRLTVPPVYNLAALLEIVQVSRNTKRLVQFFEIGTHFVLAPRADTKDIVRPAVGRLLGHFGLLNCWASASR